MLRSEIFSDGARQWIDGSGGIPAADQVSFYDAIPSSDLAGRAVQWDFEQNHPQTLNAQSVSPMATVTKTISGFTLYPQESANWCAFATAKMVLHIIVTAGLKLSCPLVPPRLRIIVGHDADRLTLTNNESGLQVFTALETGIAGIPDTSSTLGEIFVARNMTNLIGDALRLRSPPGYLVATTNSWFFTYSHL